MWRDFTSKDLTLIICFTALYSVLSLFPVSQLIGLPGKTLTAATIFALVVGVLLGPYFGFLSTLFGGVIATFINPSFSPPSLVAGFVAALFAGLLYAGKRGLSVLLYSLLLVFFGFYPQSGPVWLYPLLMWFQLVGLIMLVSPVQSRAVRNINASNKSKLFASTFVLFLISTLAGQIAGSLTFEIVFVNSDLGYWKLTWLGTTFLYPIERIIIAFLASLIGAPLYRILKSTNLMVIHTHLHIREKPS